MQEELNHTAPELSEEQDRSVPTGTTSLPHPRNVRWRRVLDYIKTILFTLLIALMLKTFVVEAFRIPSGSMENTLLVGDFLLVNKLAYGLRTPRYVPLTNVAIPSIALPALKSVQRGDVIVFEFPGERSRRENQESVNYIKRCIALPGDTLEILTGRVFVNGRELTVPANAKATNGFKSPHWQRSYRLFPPGAGFTEGRYGPLNVPRQGDVITLDASTFDRWRTFITREGHSLRLTPGGKVLLDDMELSTYTVERNYFFVMGDNRENSLDSRYWGFVPESNLIGEALVVYWSWDPDIVLSNFVDKAGSIRWGRIGTLIR